MRQRILLRSIENHLPADASSGQARHGAMLFSTSGRGLTTGIACGGVVGIASYVLGFSQPGLLMAGFGALLLATAATTDFRVVALIAVEGGEHQFALMRGSKVRQAATGFESWMANDDRPIQKVGSSFVTSQWRIGTQIYTATKRAEKALEEMTSGRHPQRG